MKRKIYNKIKRINKNIKIDIKKNINKIKISAPYSNVL